MRPQQHPATKVKEAPTLPAAARGNGASRYRGRDPQIKSAFERNAPITFDTKRGKKDHKGEVKQSWQKYGGATTVAQALALGASASDLKYDMDNGLMSISSQERNHTAR